MSTLLKQSVITYYGRAQGKHLLVLGGVHGNEPCGTLAIERAIAAIEAGSIKISKGAVTFIPVANPLARSLGTREGEKDMNRGFNLVNDETAESRMAPLLAKVMENCDVLLDLHSFRAAGSPFIFLGPENNGGQLQPFRRGGEELLFAQSLGLTTMVYGWLPAYDTFVREQGEVLDQAGITPQQFKRAAVDFGIGTTEYFRRLGKYGLTLECGNHADPGALLVAFDAILRALGHLDITPGPQPEARPFNESFHFFKIFVRENENDSFARQWSSFNKVAKGELLGRRATGEELRAPSDGIVLFPYSDALVGEEWIYFAETSERGRAIG